MFPLILALALLAPGPPPAEADPPLATLAAPAAFCGVTVARDASWFGQRITLRVVPGCVGEARVRLENPLTRAVLPRTAPNYYRLNAYYPREIVLYSSCSWQPSVFDGRRFVPVPPPRQGEPCFRGG